MIKFIYLRYYLKCANVSYCTLDEPRLLSMAGQWRRTDLRTRSRKSLRSTGCGAEQGDKPRATS